MRDQKSASELSWLEKLQQPQRINTLEPIAMRFILALRLIAVYRQAKRDPVPELAAKLGTLSTAISALELVETLGAVWPEPIQVGRACCQYLTPDDATLSAGLQAVAKRDRRAFDAQFEGLIKARRIALLWEQAAGHIAAEFAAS